MKFFFYDIHQLYQTYRAEDIIVYAVSHVFGMILQLCGAWLVQNEYLDRAPGDTT